MIKRTSKADIDAYFSNDTHIGQSSLKKLLQGVNAFLAADEKKLYYVEKGHFIIGSGVDVMLTQEKDDFDDEYHITNSDKPSGKTLSIMHHIFDNVTENMNKQHINRLTFEQLSDDTILEACVIHDFQGRWKDPAKLKAVAKTADYFNELCLSNGKQIITTEDYDKIVRITESFETSKWKHLFDGSLENNTKYDVYFQLAIYSEKLGIKTKVLLDFVVVDHEKKTITPYDIKTTGDAIIKFPYSAKAYRYDFQGSYYMEHLKYWRDQQPALKGYAINNFRFLVESTVYVSGTTMFKADKLFLKIGGYGKEAVYGASFVGQNKRTVYVETHKAVHGWKYAVELYKWHLNNGFDKDKELVDSNHILTLTWGKASNED